MEQDEIIFLSGRANFELGKEIAAFYNNRIVPINYVDFKDGEFKPIIGDNIRGRDVVIIQSTNAVKNEKQTSSSDNLFELLLLIDAAKRASAREIIVGIPYFGWARQERKSDPRSPISAKVVAELIEFKGASRIITMDLHADAIQGFFSIPVDNLYSSFFFYPVIQKIITPDTVFSSADEGGVRRAKKYAARFNTDLIICYKHKIKDNTVEDIRVLGDPKGKDVIIPEDIIDTATTLCKTADVLMDKGAKSVKAIIPHGVLSGDAYENLSAAPIVKCYISDSHKNYADYVAVHGPHPKIEVISCKELFAKGIRNHIERKSIQELYLL
ncbi:MAG: ribose-phosphate diphosphokinase [Candidatus Absconditabacterales bacterium]|jgi:ribose-phosphate pyrophosphokinase